MCKNVEVEKYNKKTCAFDVATTWQNTRSCSPESWPCELVHLCYCIRLDQGLLKG